MLMTLITAHRILIATAVVFFLFYALWEFAHRTGVGGLGSPVRGAMALLAAAVLAIYFTTLRRRRASPGGTDRGGTR